MEIKNDLLQEILDYLHERNLELKAAVIYWSEKKRSDKANEFLSKQCRLLQITDQLTRAIKNKTP